MINIITDDKGSKHLLKLTNAHFKKQYKNSLMAFAEAHVKSLTFFTPDNKLNGITAIKSTFENGNYLEVNFYIFNKKTNKNISTSEQMTFELFKDSNAWYTIFDENVKRI